MSFNTFAAPYKKDVWTFKISSSILLEVYAS